jgi:uncharacterized protein
MLSYVEDLARRSKFIPSICILFLLLLCGCQTNDEYTGSVWKISDQKSDATTGSVHILGSMHFVSNDDIKMSKTINELFDKSTIVVFESNPKAEEKDFAFISNSDLAKFIDANTLNGVISHFKEIGLTDKQINKAIKIHPYGIYRYLIESAPQRRNSQKSNLNASLKYPGVDSRLHALALSKGKTIVYLETVEDVIRLWGEHCPGKTEYSALISDVLLHLSGEKKLPQGAASAYHSLETGETDKFLEWYTSEVVQQSTEVSINQRCSNNPRNFFWKSKIVDYIKSDKNVLVVIGISHLVGEKSIVNLLKNDGFKAERVVN